MKRKIIMLALAMSVLFTGCGNNSGSSDEASSKEASVQEEKKTDVKEESAESYSEDDIVSGKLPVGYIEENGYSNAYFGFKLAMNPENEQQQSDMTQETVQMMVESMNMLDSDEELSIEERLMDYLESADPGEALTTYITGTGAVWINGEHVGLQIFVGKLSDDVTKEAVLENKKKSAAADASISENDITVGQVSLGGVQRDSYTWQTASGVNQSAVFCFTDDYYCELDFDACNSLESVCSSFEQY